MIWQQQQLSFKKILYKGVIDIAAGATALSPHCQQTLLAEKIYNLLSYAELNCIPIKVSKDKNTANAAFRRHQGGIAIYIVSMPRAYTCANGNLLANEEQAEPSLLAQ